jgi:hypothetical protein
MFDSDSRFAVLACFGVQTRIRQEEPLDGMSADDVFVNDPVDIALGHVPVPHGLWIDHDGRTMLALIEATGLIGADFTFQPALSQFLFE